MIISIDVPVVIRCSIEGCSYNSNNNCHAKAITIGNGETPLCDTLLCDEKEVQEKNILAGVGACKVSQCRFNNDLECIADDISVGSENDNVRCMTYALQ